jgi:hypothetical protein
MRMRKEAHGSVSVHVGSGDPLVNRSLIEVPALRTGKLGSECIVYILTCGISVARLAYRQGRTSTREIYTTCDLGTSGLADGHVHSIVSRAAFDHRRGDWQF